MSSTAAETLRGFYVENRQPLYTYAVSITRHEHDLLRFGVSLPEALSVIFDYIESFYNRTDPLEFRLHQYRSIPSQIKLPEPLVRESSQPQINLLVFHARVPKPYRLKIYIFIAFIELAHARK
jgi:hypothetical protein